ncbi:response regulator [Chitinibacter tainanensis]|uniref:response regulator n=1 Tax=Chitinibacter tainanensis TaxID=230667 RepID=UPI0003F8719C|nr:response regulator [Chitinibacter tainanensis]
MDLFLEQGGAAEPLPLVLVVDDDRLILQLVQEYLSSEYRVLTAKHGQLALAVLEQEPVAAVLTDIKMPILDGLGLCQAMRADPRWQAIPVMMMSGSEYLDELLQVYDVGGQSFITKPLDPKLLKTQLAHMLQQSTDRALMQSQLQFATQTAFTAMSSVGETGALLQALKAFNSARTPQALCRQIIEAIRGFELEAVVGVMDRQQLYALNMHGPASQLETAILQRMSSMERVVQFSNRLSIHFQQVRLIINNLPTDDTERCGRLRDNLAILIEAADTSLKAIDITQTALRRQETVLRSIQSLTAALDSLDQQQRLSNQNRGISFSNGMMQLERAFAGLGLSDAQEAVLLNIVRDTWEQIATSYSDESGLQNRLSGIIQHLQESLQQAE